MKINRLGNNVYLRWAKAYGDVIKADLDPMNLEEGDLIVKDGTLGTLVSKKPWTASVKSLSDPEGVTAYGIQVFPGGVSGTSTRFTIYSRYPIVPGDQLLYGSNGLYTSTVFKSKLVGNSIYLVDTESPIEGTMTKVWLRAFPSVVIDYDLWSTNGVLPWAYTNGDQFLQINEDIVRIKKPVPLYGYKLSSLDYRVLAGSVSLSPGNSWVLYSKESDRSVVGLEIDYPDASFTVTMVVKNMGDGVIKGKVENTEFLVDPHGSKTVTWPHSGEKITLWMEAPAGERLYSIVQSLVVLEPLDIKWVCSGEGEDWFTSFPFMKIGE